MNGFARLPGLLVRARTSPFWLWVLNQLLGHMIPFNRPHGVRICAVDPDRVRASAKYRRRNQNHLRGIHACAIATVAEFSSGMLLLSRLDPARYRLIMAHLEIDYLYQAKCDIVAESVLNDEVLEREVLIPLRENGKLVKNFETLVSDRQGNLVARARIAWQIKAWEQVRTGRPDVPT
jgi:acyl-coenzyme A thioesterase PaaI-like protein